MPSNLHWPSSQSTALNCHSQLSITRLSGVRGRDICVHGLSAAVLLSKGSPGIISLDTALNPGWLLQPWSPGHKPFQRAKTHGAETVLQSPAHLWHYLPLLVPLLPPSTGRRAAATSISDTPDAAAARWAGRVTGAAAKPMLITLAGQGLAPSLTLTAPLHCLPLHPLLWEPGWEAGS